MSTQPAPKRERPPVNARLARRPWDEKRNLPIPVFNENDDGTDHNFLLVNFTKSARCAKFRLCGVCGEDLGQTAAFLGGPISANSRCYVDPGMHESCARDALILCPHLSIPHASRASDERVGESTTTKGMSLKRPEFLVMGITRSWNIVYSSPHGPHIRANPWVRTHVFKYENFRLAEQPPGTAYDVPGIRP